MCLSNKERAVARGAFNREGDSFYLLFFEIYVILTKSLCQEAGTGGAGRGKKIIERTGSIKTV